MNSSVSASCPAKCIFINGFASLGSITIVLVSLNNGDKLACVCDVALSWSQSKDSLVLCDFEAVAFKTEEMFVSYSSAKYTLNNILLLDTSELISGNFQVVSNLTLY